MRRVASKASALGRFLRYLWRERAWWMIPLVLILVLLGVLVAMSSSTAVAPFIYTLF